MKVGDKVWLTKKCLSALRKECRDKEAVKFFAAIAHEIVSEAEWNGALAFKLIGFDKQPWKFRPHELSQKPINEEPCSCDCLHCRKRKA